jgi:hypothetical protein
VGVGDAFNGGFLSGVLKGKNWKITDDGKLFVEQRLRRLAVMWKVICQRNDKKKTKYLL